MQEHKFIVIVKTEKNYSRKKIRKALNSIIDIGYADAHATMETDMDNGQAETVTNLDIEIISKDIGLYSDELRYNPNEG